MLEMFAITFNGLLIASTKLDGQDRLTDLTISAYPHMEESDQVNVKEMFETQAGSILDLDEDDDYSGIEILKSLQH